MCKEGNYLQLSRKARIEILRLASTLKYTNGNFQHFHCLFESETINPDYIHQTMSCTIITQYNICSTISAVEYLQYNICSTISAVQYLQYNICSRISSQSTHYPGDLVLTHEGVKNLYISLHQYLQDVYLVCLS